MNEQDQITPPDGDYGLSRVPLTGLVARRLILKCFERQDQWTRQDLTKEVEQTHLGFGGFRGAQPTLLVVKKVLGELRAEGIAVPVSRGLWRYVAEADALPTDVDANKSSSASLPPEALEDEEAVGRLQINEEVGTGDESVYLYYNPNDVKLAQAEGRSTWECKVGHTVGMVDTRILDQGARTALSHYPVVGLVIRTKDARTLESVLHRSLRLTDSAVADSPGNEWFITSPAHVKAWHAAYMASLDLLGSKSTFGSDKK